MTECAACAAENPAGSRFCNACGSPLSGAAAPAREERKVVSVLFADLVGFTSRSERADVEDVRGTLAPYHARLRRILEGHGGTVEKFIGDAVVAVFGAPIAHEDDAERAVRAALAVRDAVAEMPGDLHVRVAVNTGEALVAVDARTELGEGIASGDVVNTAARLQSAAPVDGVLVGEATFRATERQILYEPHDPVVAKGKADAVACSIAVAPRSIVPGAVRNTLPLVGRTFERDTLVTALRRVRAERTVQLVTLVGVPGIGKSRIVDELREIVEDEPDLTTWRQGRVLAYGDGVALRAFADMVRQECGILESDDAATTAAKLADGVAGSDLTGADARWVERQLAPLLGLPTTDEGGALQEAYSGWRLFVEALAERTPAVLVFDDLHWADDVLLDFIDQLVDRLSGAPALVICTARPELLERRPGWGGGKPNATTLLLQPLSRDEIGALLEHLIDPRLLPPETESRLLERAGGNPLYAQEYVRMVVERGVRGADGLPETVQGIIAARLDGLPSEEKTLLQDAAVMGQTSWLGALRALGGHDSGRADELLYGLERKQLLRRERRSTIAGETELRFAHALVADVAYAQLTRAQRAQRHEAAADWIGRIGADGGDRAEITAHHLGTALALHEQLGTATDDLRARMLAATLVAMRQAAARHDHGAAIAYADAVLAQRPELPRRAEALVARALAGAARGGMDTAELEAACDAARAAGRTEDAVAVLIALTRYEVGDADRFGAYVELALELAATLPPGPVTTLAPYARGYHLCTTGQSAAALALAAGEIERARAAGVQTAEALMLVWHGAARLDLGDPGGLDDMRRAYAFLDRHAHPKAAVTAYNLAETLVAAGRLDEAAAMYDEGAAWAQRLGQPADEMWLRLGIAEIAYHQGDRPQALLALEEAAATDGDDFGAMLTIARRGFLGAEADDRVVDDAERLIDFGDRARNREFSLLGMALRAWAAWLRGSDGAAEACDAFLATWREGVIGASVMALAHLGVVLAALGRTAELREAAGALGPSPWRDALLHLADARYAEAADAFAAIPSVPLRDAALRLAQASSPAASAETNTASS